MKEKNNHLYFSFEDLDQMRQLLDLANNSLPLREGLWNIRPDTSACNDYTWVLSLDITNIDDFCVFLIKAGRKTEDDLPRFYAASRRYLGKEEIGKEVYLSNLLESLPKDYSKWIKGLLAAP
jgi:hypothetical protein